jgi:lysophospholipase L1-like esterase
MLLTNNGALTVTAGSVDPLDVAYQGGIAVKASTGAVYIDGIFSKDINGNDTGLVGSDGGVIAESAFLNSKGIGTRVPFGRMGTLSNSPALTFHVTAEVATHFDAIRPIFASCDAARAYQHTLVKMSVLSSVATDADMLNNSGTWVNAQTQSQVATPLKVAMGGTTSRIAYTTTDWLQISSIDRTDGGILPLVAIRVYNSDVSATSLPVYGNGTDNFTNWETKDTPKWFSRKFTGDGVTTPANFTGGTSATPISQSSIIGFQYLARGKVVTVCGVGDSITEGRGTYLGEGFIQPACEALSQNMGIPVEYFNAGYSGQTMAANIASNFAGRALDILNSPLCPDVLVMPIGSPNDEASTLTAAGVNLQKRAMEILVNSCKEKGVALVLWTWLPANYAVLPRGATDSLRVAYNTEQIAYRDNMCDLSTLFTGALDVNSQWTMLYTADGIHPNNAGNQVATTAITPYIKSAILGG